MVVLGCLIKYIMFDSKFNNTVIRSAFYCVIKYFSSSVVTLFINPIADGDGKSIDQYDKDEYSDGE